MNLSLIGYRGAGKSAVAQLVALKLGWDWIDSDVEIELRAGKSIAAIFAADGEPAFRDLESQVVADLTERQRTVFAWGGGVVLRPENRAAIGAAGKVAWLEASPETLWRRTTQDQSTPDRRPNLTNAGGLNEITDILALRAEFYRECADWRVDTEGKTPADVAAEILELPPRLVIFAEQAIVAWPLEWILAALFFLGAFVGSLVNLAAYRLAFNQRLISPWSAAPKKVSPRGWFDCVPIVGWLALRRESHVHGRYFWVRPLLVELSLGVLFAFLYWNEVEHTALVRVFDAKAPAGAFVIPVLDAIQLPLYGHLILVTLMAAATLIDLDEKTIPDEITVTGSCIGLALIALSPWSLLPAAVWWVGQSMDVEFLSLVTPAEWPDRLQPVRAEGLIVALVAWWWWCFALLDRRWITKHGWRTAFIYFLAHLRRRRHTGLVMAMGLIGSGLIGLAWMTAAASTWAAIVSSLGGLAIGGGVIWVVRLIGQASLGQEAMGFGDVTLMSMIGAFLGWQPCVIVFFLAPVLAVAFALAQWITRGEREIPFGPFLCLATTLTIVWWGAIWDWAEQYFALGWILLAVLGGGLVLMGLMLWAWRWLRDRQATN